MTAQPPFRRPLSVGAQTLLATAAYLLLAILVTWPVAARLAGAVGGFDGRDSFQHVWLFWWFWEALLNRWQLPAYVDVLYFPQGAFHPVLWLHPFVPLWGLPLTGVIGSRATYNIALLLSIALSGTSGFLLARNFVKTPAAFLGGLIFAFAPTRMGHTLAGHQLLVFNLALPLYALALHLWLRRPSRRVSSLYTISLFLVLISHPNFVGFFLLPVTLVLMAAHWWRFGWFSTLQRWRLLVCWAVAAIAFLPFAWPLLVELTGQNLGYLTPTNPAEHSADLLSFVTPSPYHPLWNDSPPSFITAVLDRPRALEEGFNYLGLSVLALVGLAVWQRRRPVTVWLALALLSAVLALGPALKIGGHETGLPLPYALLINLPFFSWGRTPGRLNITTMLAVSVMAAVGANWLLTKIQKPALNRLLVIGLSGLILLEYLPMWPFPIDPLAVPNAYRTVVALQPGQGLLDMPVFGSRRASNYAMFYQTVHRRPMVNGYIERDPPGTQEIQQFADRLLSPPPVLPEVLVTPTLDERRAILHDLGIAQVVAHPDQLTDSAARATLSFMPHLLGDPVYADETLLIWNTPPVETDVPSLARLLAEDGWEGLTGGTVLRLKEAGLLFVYAAKAGPATLTIQPAAPLEGDKTLLINDEAVSGDATIQVPLQLRAKLNWISFRLTGCNSCDLDFERITVKQGRSP